MSSRNIRFLQDLGLNNLEAEVYLFLLTNAPQTAYHVGKKLGKPTANVYKAVDALNRKGAVLVEEGDNRLCRAVPISEFLNHVKKDFLAKATRVKESLANLKMGVCDEAVYRLLSPSLVLERCRSMLGQCRKIAVIDAFPEPLKFIRSAIERAISRKIEIYLQVYEPVDISGANIAVTPDGEKALKYWACQQLNVVVDGREHLLSLMNQDLSEVYQAVWSQSLYLSCILHAGLLQEHSIHRLRAAAGHPDALKQMRAILSESRFFLNTDVPGQKTLSSRYMLGVSDVDE